MYKGFHNAVSGVLTQSRTLNAISNNITNMSTPGYKRDIMTSTTFNDVLAARLGNIDKSNPAELGELSSIRTVDGLFTVFTQGAITQTDRVFDFAIQGDGFFQLETEGGLVYTRNGSFTLDEDGYLCLQGVGHVLCDNGRIWLGTEDFTVGADGSITSGLVGNVGRMRIVDFEDYGVLTKNAAGMFEAPVGGVEADRGQTTLQWQALEESNADMIDASTSMIEAQRAFQSASQILRLYDQLNDKSHDIARV